MPCPLTQMCEDHYEDVRIFKYFTKRYQKTGSGRNHGERMWFMATCGMSLAASEHALGEDWIYHLERKYGKRD